MNKFIDINSKYPYDYIVDHPLQTYEWGEFRKKTGVKIIRRGLVKNKSLVDGFTLTIHKVPFTPFNIGYLPKGNQPSDEILQELYRIGKENHCIYIQLEPNVIRNHELGIKNHGKNTEKLNLLIHNSSFVIHDSFHSLFTKYTFMLDLTRSEEELLKNMHPKTRYNIKVAQKHNLWIEEDNSEEGFEQYFKLVEETTNRQKFYAHTKKYHKLLWQTIPKFNDHLDFSYHLLHAKYKDDNKNIHTLVSWVLFVFHKTLYYPYGASSTEYRNTMASNLMMWEAIKLGKKLGLTNFDMWGALGPNPDPKDPWFGFHKFKQGYGTNLTEFIGSYDLVIKPSLYRAIKFADKIRWLLLRINK